MVKVGKLWGDAKFASLSPNSKLLYCYLLSQPNITTLGVLVLDLERVNIDLKIGSIDELQYPFSELDANGYIEYFMSSDKVVTAIVVDHYHSLAKSKANIRKGLDEGKASKGKIKEILLDLFTVADFQNDSFVPPTPQEVSDYALSLGFLVNGKNFVEYYGDNDWYDKNNKLVRNWKSKVSKVWCRDTNKLETADGAPKGFEYFFTEIEDGHRVYPQSWVNGLPSHSNHIYAQYLIDEYNVQKDSR